MVCLRRVLLATAALASLASAFPTGTPIGAHDAAAAAAGVNIDLKAYTEVGAKVGLFTRTGGSSSASATCESSCTGAAATVSSCVDEIKGIISGAGWSGSSGIDVGVTAGLDAAAQVTAISKVLTGIELSLASAASVVGALEADASADVVSTITSPLARKTDTNTEPPSLTVPQSALAAAAGSLTTQVNAAISTVASASLDGLASLAADFENQVSGSLQTCVKGASTVCGSGSAFGTTLAGIVGSAGLSSTLAVSVGGAIGISL